MAGGKGKGVVPGAGAGGAEPSVALRLWRVVRAVLYMLRRGVGVPSGRKLAMDLHLLLHRSKIAGKALGDLVTFHHHHHHAGAFSAAGSSSSSSSFSCRALDPVLAVYEPSRGRREVEFSCSTTPSYAAGGLLGAATGRRRHRHSDDAAAGWYHNYDAAEIARVFEIFNDSERLFNDDDSPEPATTAPPSPAPLAWTTTAARQPRITDSPFAARDGGGEHEQQIDRQADEFIRRFYEQLRAQPQSVAATPDYYYYGARSCSSGRAAARPVAASIA